MCSCASGDSPTCTVVSTLSPCSARLQHRLDAVADLVLKRSRGMYTSAEKKRP